MNIPLLRVLPAYFLVDAEVDQYPSEGAEAGHEAVKPVAFDESTKGLIPKEDKAEDAAHFLEPVFRRVVGNLDVFHDGHISS